MEHDMSMDSRQRFSTCKNEKVYKALSKYSGLKVGRNQFGP